MKTLFSLILAFCFLFTVNAQDPDTLSSGKNKDTTNITIGKKEIQIVDKNGETEIKVKNREGREEDQEDMDKESEPEDQDSHRRSGRHFKGHWDAFQIGINSYLASNKSLTLPDDIAFMDLNTNKSININLNMFQQSFGLIGRSVGVVTGVGLEFTNYVFDGNNTIIKGENGIIIPEYPPFNLTKSKLTTTYLTVPLLLEFQFPGEKRSNRLYVNGGVIGGVKLGSHTKFKYKEDGDKQDEKNKNDFNLNSLKYGITAKIGIKHLSIYGIYYPMTLFEKGKGPELYPFMIGFSFDGF